MQGLEFQYHHQQWGYNPLYKPMLSKFHNATYSVIRPQHNKLTIITNYKMWKSKFRNKWWAHMNHCRLKYSNITPPELDHNELRNNIKWVHNVKVPHNSLQWYQNWCRSQYSNINTKCPGNCCVSRVSVPLSICLSNKASTHRMPPLHYSSSSNDARRVSLSLRQSTTRQNQYCCQSNSP